MGFRHDFHYRLVSRIYNRPISDLINAIFAQVPLDPTCKVNISVHGEPITLYKDEPQIDDRPKGGVVEIDFATLFYRRWESPTYDAAVAFVKASEFHSILVHIDDLDEDAMFFGLAPYRVIAASQRSIDQ